MVFKQEETINDIIKDVTKKEIIVQCACNTHMFRISSFSDDKIYYINIWSANFYNKQKQPLHLRIWHRLKLIWFAISGKEYRLEDFVLTKEDMDAFIIALQEIRNDKQEVK